MLYYKSVLAPKWYEIESGWERRFARGEDVKAINWLGSVSIDNLGRNEQSGLAIQTSVLDAKSGKGVNLKMTKLVRGSKELSPVTSILVLSIEQETVGLMLSGQEQATRTQVESWEVGCFTYKATRAA